MGVVYRPVATDPENAALTYTLSGPDAARFVMNATTREVRFVAQDSAGNETELVRKTYVELY